MAELIVPRHRVAPSVRAAVRADPSDAFGDYLRAAELGDGDLDRWVDDLLADTRERSARPAGWVPSTHLWWVEGDRYLGRVNIRHRLTPFLREVGGHIGYHVVAAERRKGHATAMLAATLPVAAALGIDCALITCDEDNVASAKVIEANGGLAWDRHNGKRRYWVPTAPASTT